MGGTALLEMVPQRDEEWGSPIDEPTRAGSGGDGDSPGGAPGLRRFTIRPVGNPLLEMDRTELVWARAFWYQIEQQLARRRRERQKGAQDTQTRFEPMRRIERDLRELPIARSDGRPNAQMAEGGIRHNENTGNERPAYAVTRDLQAADADRTEITDTPLRIAAERLADELDRACAGDAQMCTLVLDRFWTKFSEERFAAPDLMGLMLLSHEEVIWEESGSDGGLEGGWSGTRLRVPRPDARAAADGQEGAWQQALGRTAGAARMENKRSLDQLQTVQRAGRRAEVEVRLISIREMLLHYFQAYPQEYPASLAAVLGLSMAELADAGLLEERIAFEVARNGSWALALRIWQEIARRQKMDDEEKPDAARAARRTGPLSMGIVPPFGRARTGWRWCPNWKGMPLGQAVSMLAKMIFNS